MRSNSDSSWQEVHHWYNASVGAQGHYYHRQVILPKTLALLQLEKGDHLLDVGCGQGVLARAIPSGIAYTGIDLAHGLIKSARQQSDRPHQKFLLADARHFSLEGHSFSHAAALLSMQNIDRPDLVFACIAKHLLPGGCFVLVLNHPAFRIPRHSRWLIEPERKVQSRCLDSYLSPLQIPIDMHPGSDESHTWSFHFPLSSYSQWLSDAGFLIERIEEWVSDKTSSGRNGRMENRARSEFPLFLAMRVILRGGKI